MRRLNTAGGVDYGILELCDAVEMVTLLADVFSRSEPMAVAINLPSSQVSRLVDAFVPKAVSEQLTILARNQVDGRLVGALLADDFGTPPPSGLDDAAPLFAPVGTLLDGLDEQYRATTTVSPGTHAHLFMVGVSPDAERRGIARQLVAVCCDQARRLGYRTAVTEATGAASQHVFRKNAFLSAAVARYSEFTHDGQRVFAEIQGVEGTVLMTRDLHDRP